MRADKIGDEFNVQYAMIAQAMNIYVEAQRSGAPVIVPLNFPKPYDLSDMIDAKAVSISQMKHWEMAPSNPRQLMDADVKIAYINRLKDKTKIWDALRKVYRTGYPNQHC